MNMKKSNIFQSGLLAVASLAIATGCSDWDDHYEANSCESATSTQTLWNVLSTNQEFSNFADLVKKVKMDGALNTEQVYTVWAPKNGSPSFDYNYWSQKDSATIMTQFIGNHIARFNHPATGLLDNSDSVITTLNEKRMAFENIGGYRFNGTKVIQANTPASNGTLHVLADATPFRFNLYENVDNENYQLDSLKNYLHRYDTEILDKASSVEGPIVNGQITYLSSVYFKTNFIYSELNGAYINSEDSSYTMIYPTNTAWQKAIDAMKDKFKYIPSARFRNLRNNNTQETVEMDAEYLKDSLPKHSIVANLIYNNNLFSNSILKKLPNLTVTTNDSALTTMRNIAYGEDITDMFVGATKAEMSNGIAWITDTLRYKPWLTWNPIIVVEGEDTDYSNDPENRTGTANTVRVTSTNKNPAIKQDVSGTGYMDVVPASTSAQPIISYYLPNVLSTSYHIFVDFVPANIRNANITSLKPNRVKFQLTYHTEDGTSKNVTFDNDGNNFVTDSSCISTVHVGEFTFPIAYRGVVATNGFYPALQIATRVSGKDERAIYDRELRIDRIYLIPTELIEYVKTHPDYKIGYTKLGTVTHWTFSDILKSI